MGGWKGRRDRYLFLSQKIREGLGKFGIKTLLPLEDYSCVLTSFELPPGYSYEKIHDGFKEAGFVIYAGQGGLTNSIFRIANMGNIQNDDLQNLLKSCRDLFG